MNPIRVFSRVGSIAGSIAGSRVGRCAMCLSRKGIMYTLVSIIMILIIGTIFISVAKRSSHEAFAATESRVQTMEGFLKDVERDSERAAHIAGFRSLIAMEQKVATTGMAFNVSDGVLNLTPDAAFMESFVNGTIGGTHYSIMDDSTFSEYLLRVQDTAATQGIICNMSVINITLWQTDAWHLRVNYTLDIQLSDVSHIALWRTNRTFIGQVPIIDIRDPLFSMNTYGRVQRTIRPDIGVVFVNVSGNKNDTSGFIYHYNNSLYTAAGRGPSILMRFANNFSDSVYGIESLVDIKELNSQNITVDNRASVVDYLYFNRTPAIACNISNITNKLPVEIKIDAAHIAVYQINLLNYSACT